MNFLFCLSGNVFTFIFFPPWFLKDIAEYRIFYWQVLFFLQHFWICHFTVYGLLWEVSSSFASLFHLCNGSFFSCHFMVFFLWHAGIWLWYTEVWTSACLSYLVCGAVVFWCPGLCLAALQVALEQQDGASSPPPLRGSRVSAHFVSVLLFQVYWWIIMHLVVLVVKFTLFGPSMTKILSSAWLYSSCTVYNTIRQFGREICGRAIGINLILG